MAAAIERSASGHCRGTSLLTKHGEVAVENLNPEMRIVTRDAGLVTLRNIQKKHQAFRPVKIRAGSVGHSRPQLDARVAPGTLLYLRDWRAKAMFGSDTACVPAWRMIDGEYVSLEKQYEIEVFELYFDRQHVLLAEGIEVLSAEA